ncbi:Regulator of chromosome condensation (RCC1) repeat [Popillia japonica]|uniref:Regulator of chromosome condensation (RCC1) repeat n=1 Tax=Popillia japonica TaxID=7064 RepID=A0AAW1MIK8_POPJA
MNTPECPKNNASRRRKWQYLLWISTKYDSNSYQLHPDIVRDFARSAGKVHFLYSTHPMTYLKWLKSDLQAVFYSQDSLNSLWNGLMNDGELTGPFSDGLLNSAGVTARKGELGKYYCGLRVLTCACCDGICGPTNGCNCQPCQKLDAEEQNIKQDEKRLPSPQFLLDSWTWGPQPSLEQLKTFILSLNHEQRRLCSDAVNSSLSSTRLQQRLTIFKRYFIALNRAPHTSEFDTNITLRNNNKVDTKDYKIPTQKCKIQDPTASLARVGSRAALNFSFAFLKRAWRLGEDVDLCNELLTESLEALQVLPVATLFDENQVSPIWLEVVDRSVKFLRQVVIGDVTSGRQYCEVPIEDQHVALNLLLELALQKGTLSSVLDSVLLFLQLWEKKTYSDDNRSLPANASAPLLPFLKRFEEISLTKSPPTCKDEKDDTPNCTNMFLKYLTVPEDDSAEVDLKQGAILLMSHLDRLASPHLPSQSFNKVNLNTNRQQVWCWGWLAWVANVGPQLCDAISELNIKQLRCSERSLLALTRDGKVYFMYFCSETPCPQLIEGLKDKEVIKIAAHTEGKHYLALTKDSEVYSWGNGDNGRLGHGDNISKDDPTLIEALKDKDIIDVECGGTYSAAISANGALYTWGRGNYGRLGHGTSEDCSTPTMVAALSDHHIRRRPPGGICITSQGKVYSWGDGDYGKLGRGGSDGSKIPRLVEKLQNVEIAEVYCGGQFSIALAKDGRLFSWGKGEGWRLGHTTDEHIRFPEVVESLQDKKVISVSLGLGHVLALTEHGEVYGWGKNEYKQVCDTSESYIQQPRLIESLKVQRSVGICCGPMQSFVWSDIGHWLPNTRVPFVIDITEQTFKLLDQLLEVVCENSRSSAAVNLPISQDKEYIAIATLNLLHLQV